jgi:Holliday junction DNA helicase RuvA
VISRLSGTLVSKTPTDVVIDVHGVGYALSIPLSTYEALGETGSSATLCTHLHVREDALQLYGFATEEERELFRMLLAVTGIGPKMAQGILSGIPGIELKNHIVSGNTGALVAIPGIGRKIAERLILELRDKIGKLGPSSTLLAGASGEESRVRSEALLALVALGFQRGVAEKALRDALLESRHADASVESLIKASLRHAPR